MDTMCIIISPSKVGGRSRTAFTLVELMIGVTVMAIMFIALFRGIDYGFRETQLARENLRATQILLERMEGVRLYTFDQLVSSNMFATTFTNLYYPLASANQSPGITYYGRFAISNMSTGAAYNDNLRLITVTVNWTNCYGTNVYVPRNRQMQTMVARYGIQNYVWGK